MVVTPPGQTRTVVFRYELPTTVSVGTYSLVVQKQPGVPDFPIKLGGTSALDAVGQISLDGSQFFDGHGAGPRRADRLLGLQDGQASQPVCDIFRDPPEVLHPPVALTIPKIDVEANVVGLGVEDSGRLEAPATGNVTGWYVQSGRPGQVGNSIMSGHVDWDKRPAVFWRLSELREGDLVEVRTEEQQWTYRIEWIRRFDAKTDAVGTILGPTYDRLLTLITCDGPFDAITGDYAERLVVRARLVP
jgi:LPXTG-site transpeptidase (sortase) family protein